MAPKSLLFLALNLTFCGGAIALAQSVPEGARITDVRISGTGCDAAQAAVVLSPDLKDMSVFFDNYVVEVGVGSRNPNQLRVQRDCKVQIQLQVPDGWEMAFKGADYRGFVALGAQGTAFHRFSIHQEGAPMVSMKEANLTGPKNEDYYVRSEIKPERVTWSRCLNGLVNVDLISHLGVALNPRSSDRSMAMIALDASDTSFKQSLSVDWRRCNVSRPDPNPRPPGPIRPGPREPRPREPRPPRFGGR